MKAGPSFLRVGLTGGIASGKTTVARMFEELGAAVVDADAVVHDLLAPGGEGARLVAEHFGPGFLAPDGGVDRRRLGEVVFSDPRARRRLNGLLHPLVRREAMRRLEEAVRRKGARIGVLDAALLVETGAWRDLDKLVVVRCPVEVQVARLRERDGLSRDEAMARIRAQAPLEEKLRVADAVVDTDVPLDETRRQVEAVYRRLLDEIPQTHRDPS